ncbi:MAG TPA: hypothetical protein VIV62_07560, partial [Chthoniobacterales bacterium]
MKARVQARCFDLCLIPPTAEKCQPLLVYKLEPRAHNLRHDPQTPEDLGSSILVFKHDRRGAVVGGDFADDAKFVGRVLFQNVGLKAKKSGKGRQQHRAGNQHDDEGDFLP